MRTGKAWRWGLAVLLLPGCMAAPPAAPAPALGTTPPAAGAAAAAPASAPPNLWSFLCPTEAQKQACRQKLCNSFLGKMLVGILTPVRMFTGGSTTSACSQLSDTLDLAKPADSAEGAAARIKQEEAGVEARREAVRYLGTCDCRYWPEAEGALIKALRSDPNECVRYEAAAALKRGCCCNRATLEALVTTVSGGDKDGFPAERSERVKATAVEALHHCLENCSAVTVAPVPTPTRPEKPTPPEKPTAPTPPPPEKTAAAGPRALLPPPPRIFGVVQSGYYQNLSPRPDAGLLEEARRLDTQYPPWPHPGQNGILGLLFEIQDVPIRPRTAAASGEPPLFPVSDFAVDGAKPK